jgi:hypothetical protein
MKSDDSCRHLRTKAMFVPAPAGDDAPPEQPPPTGGSHCWCNCTLSETGPDDRPAGPEVCHPPRACFEE